MRGSDDLYFLLLHTEFLAHSFGKKKQRANFFDFGQIVEQRKSVFERHFIRCVFSSIDFSPYESKSSQKDLHQIQLFGQKLSSILSRPHFVSLLCYAIDTPLPSFKGFGPSRHLLPQISRVLKLGRAQEVMLGLALMHCGNSEVVYHAHQWIRQKLPDLIRSHLLENESVDSQAAHESTSDLVDKSPDSRGIITSGILREESEHFGVTNPMISNLLASLSRELPRNCVPLVMSAMLYPDLLEPNPAITYQEPGELPCGIVSIPNVSAPLSRLHTLAVDRHSNAVIDVEPLPDLTFWEPTTVHPEEEETDVSLLADLMEELGYACTHNLDSMRLTLAELSQREVTPAAVAKCICLFMRTADGQLRHRAPSDAFADEVEEARKGSLRTLRFGKFGTDDCGLAATSSMPTSHFSLHQENVDVIDPIQPTGSSSDLDVWNVENFLTAVFELNPAISLGQIISELDRLEFFVANRAAFLILKQCLLRDPQSQLPTPWFYGHWTHVYGQLSLLYACYNYPDVLCVNYWPYRCVDLSLYRINPGEEQAHLQIWKNIDYVQALLSLSERGLFSSVYAFLRQALHSHPDVVTATLLETAPCTARSVLLCHAFVYFLSPRTNSQPVLQTAWNGNKYQKHAMNTATLHEQRLLLLSAVVEYTAQSIAGVAEPTTFGEPTTLTSSPTVQNNLTRTVELLAGICDVSAGSRTGALLPVLLGTTEAPSAAVSVLLPSVGSGPPAIPNAFSVPFHILPQPMHSIDLALVLLVRIANAVSLAASRTNAETSSMASIQNAIRVFLLQWFTEYVRDRQVAERFAYGIVEYLRVRYASYLLSTGPLTDSKPMALITCLPMELRKPSAALLTRIIQSAQGALKSATCCLRQEIVVDISQTLSLYLQNLSSVAAQSTQISRIGSSAFGLTMKHGASGVGINAISQPQSQQQTRCTSSTVALPSSSHMYQSSDLPAVSSYGPVPEDTFCRSSAGSSLIGRLNQPIFTHGSALRKQSDGLTSHGVSYPTDHQPIALSFTNEPIKLEMTKEAEAEAYGFFQKLLKGISSPDDMFKAVCEYATQGNLSQRKLLDDVLRMLADEVSQYLPDYPEPMLPLISELYGNILAASTQLLPVRSLSILWRALLTRLHSFSPDMADSPLFRAIIRILIKAKNAFTQFYNLPGCLVSCPVFKFFPHELQEYILNAEMLANNYIRSQQTGPKPLVTTASTNAFNSVNQLTGQTSSLGVSSTSQLPGLVLHCTQSEAPPKAPDPPEEAISDRIYFLFNNVSQSNAKEKSAELTELLSDERLLPWFAYYLVGKRVPVEQTFHELFAFVLEQIQERIPNVRPKVMQELIRHIKFLLRNMRKDRDDMQARTALKNLGDFLGLITLARNKPLLHDDLNVKDLVYEAYHKGPVSSQYVVPFVARIVKGATNSVFRPPNPWTMAILKVFRELYDLKDVKDCLRFEIELLYRNFSLNVEDVPMANFLRDRNHVNNLEVQLCFFVTSDSSNNLSSATLSGAAITVVSGTDTFATGPVCSETTSIAVAPAVPVQQQQQHVLNMLVALQKQQSQQQQPITAQASTALIGASDVASTSGATNVSQSMYSISGLDLNNVIVSGNGNSNTRALVLAAALAANQSQKHLPPGQQFRSSNITSTTASGSGSASAAFSIQQKQLAVAMATLQQQLQSQQASNAVVPYTPSVSLQHGITGITPDSTVDVSGGNLRYEDVSLQTIRASLKLDDIIAVAGSVNRTASGAPAAGTNSAHAAVTLLQSNPRLRTLIEPAMSRAINELTTPVFERCARITVTTVLNVVRKDFAMDPDPNRMLYAARQMVRHLTAGMSLITAREALGVSLVTSLKNVILAEVQTASGQEKEAVQRLAHLIVARSMHTCLAFMQKSVAEKSVLEVEKKLENDLKLRTELGPRRFLEQAATQLATVQANMPEVLRLGIGGLTPSNMSVYDEFGRVIPGFAQSPVVPSAAPSLVPTVGHSNSQSTNAAQVAAFLQQQQQDISSVRMQRQISAGPGSVSLLKPLLNQGSAQQSLLLLQQQQQQQKVSATGSLDDIVAQIERHLAFISNRLCSTTDPMIRSLRCFIDAMNLAKTNRDPNVAIAVISTIVQSFLEHYRPSAWCDQPRGLETMEHLKEAYMLTLRHMLSSDQAPFGYAWVTRQVTQAWIHLDGGSISKDKQPVSLPKVSEALMEAGGESNVADSPRDTVGGDYTGDKERSVAWSKWKPLQPDASRPEGGPIQGKVNSIKWNWEAFAELLKVHVVYLSQVDAYLSQEVNAGHPGAIMFVIDLLDHFVLPCPSGTAVGAAAAAAASYARASFNCISSASGAQVGPQQATTATNSAAGVPYASTPMPQSMSQSKREFTVLNEYDLWSTLEAMRSCVNCLNAAASTRLVSLTDPLGLRLRLACARVRGLLDLGLLEQSPLFATSLGAFTPITAFYSGCSQAREFDDPPNLQEKVELLMRHWIEVYQSPRQRDPATIEAVLSQLTQIGVLPNLDNLTRFLRLATIFVIERALKHLKLQDQQQPQHMNAPPGTGAVPSAFQPGFSGANSNSSMSVARLAAYVELDAYARLISIIIRRSGELSDQRNIKVILVNKVLGIIAGTLLQEHEVRRHWFHPMPFERIFIMLFVELHSSSQLSTRDPCESQTEAVIEQRQSESDPATSERASGSSDASLRNTTRALSNLNLQQQLPLIFCHLLHCLRPEKATAFVLSWLEMLAHRWFVSRILASPVSPQLRSAYQAMYAQVLVDLLKFLGYFLQNALMPKPIQCLYKATLRLFLVLIHDFPEFVSDYYALFCDVVPSNSIQMRNLILSALPKRGIPSTDPLQAPPVDNLASLEDPTGYCMDAGSRLPEPMRSELDAYLATRAPVKLLSELVTMLRRADDILPPLPPSQFAYHPQQQARHQQALAAYAAALAANDPGGSSASLQMHTGPRADVKPISTDATVINPSGRPTAGDSTGFSEPTESNVFTEGVGEHSAARSTSGTVSSSAAAAALLWGVRATQQLATFGLADGMHYNVELMTNLALYVCITAIRNLRDKGMPLNMSTIAHTPQMDIIQSLVLNLDNEGRYLLLNCMANQLRYPNSHTYYFSYTILYLFSEQSKEQVKEQISRVLMERLIVNRPHPWGLLMTSAELLRNPAYRFWEHEFARCNPEIEAIVTIVARSCIPNFQIPTTPPSSSGGSTCIRNALVASSVSSTGDRRRQASPFSRGSPTVNDAGPSSVRAPRALNSFIPG
ncbi:unnamed protein product [Dicrocoelium dendriticum]|nr:unnamed protein product [Dicrocoelium dendriticum]